jgi:uncharacterized protein (DUF2236 family)
VEAARASVDVEQAELEGYFGPRSATWHIARERVLLVGGGRAVLMQLAHPLVAAGVGDHSAYARDPWARTFATLDLMQRITFGTRSEARAAARAINRLHTHVRGTLHEEAGAYASGTPYHARQPDLLLWVFATLIDTSLYLYPLLVGPLTEDEREAYYQESKRTVVLLGLPETMLPASLAGLQAYVDGMLASAELALIAEAREVARVILHLPAPFVLRPALTLGAAATAGWLPKRLRALYELEWDDRRQRLLEAAETGMRALLPAVPTALRYNTWAQRAYRRVNVRLGDDERAGRDIDEMGTRSA